ncbi:MAG TPA: anti-sigma factor antagonist [Candidatus Acidoferrales bacterium]|nr:anti-sigma factor antagonist [Candidatus Acidoferrales bacterium]
MPFELASKQVGRVMVIQCRGRITMGAETRALEEEVSRVTLGTKKVVLNLTEVDFADSGGLGLLVRIQRSLRTDRGDLKICGLGGSLLKVFKIIHLHTVFELYETEEQAVEAFQQRASFVSEPAKLSKRKVLCVDESKDVLAYLGVLLRRLGYEVLTTRTAPDFARFLKATKPDAVVLGQGMGANERVKEILQQDGAQVPLLFLHSGFSTADAGEAGREVADRLHDLFNISQSPREEGK